MIQADTDKQELEHLRARVQLLEHENTEMGFNHEDEIEALQEYVRLQKRLINWHEKWGKNYL